MKKSLVILLVAVLACASVFASNEFKLNLGIKNTGLDIEVKESGNKLSASNTINLDADFDMFFNKGLGMNILFGIENFEKYNLGVGFAYNIPINSNCDFVLSVGPIFSFAGKVNTFGFFTHFDFDVITGKYFYFRIGTAVDIDFLTFGDGKSDVNFNMNIPVPRVAIGWKF